MSARTLIAFSCLGLALATHSFGATEKPAGPPALPEPPLARSIPLEVAAAANAYLAAANTGDVEKMAALVYAENDAQRARITADLRRMLRPLAGLPWQGASFKALAASKDPDHSDAFVLVYTCAAPDGKRLRTVDAIMPIVRVNGAWQAAYPPTGAFAQERFRFVEAPIMMQKLGRAFSKKEAPITVVPRTQTLSSLEGLSRSDRARNLPVLHAAADIIRAWQTALPAADGAKIYLFGFAENGDQLSLLCALPLSGETPDNDPPMFRVSETMVLSYQVTDVSPDNPDAFFFSLIYWERAQAHISGNRVIAPRPVNLPGNAIFPVEVLYPQTKRNGVSDKPSFHFVLAHLPLTQSCQFLPTGAVYTRAPTGAVQPSAAKLKSP